LHLAKDVSSGRMKRSLTAIYSWAVGHLCN